MKVCETILPDLMRRHLGQTVTIFTEGGGLSGSGFTGILIGADESVVRLLCEAAAPPSCPIGRDGREFSRKPFGTVAVIPTGKIVCFTHIEA